jgi:peptide/nickel transport system ATP-binding protein
MSENSLLQIENLTAGFTDDSGKRSAVLKNVALALEAGETLGIVGESGSGKSVTSLHLMGLLPTPPAYIEHGKIHLASHELVGDPDAVKSLRGSVAAMIFQEPMTALNPVKTCGKQVTEMLRLHLKLNKAEAKQRTIELFGEVRLPDPERAFSAYPHELSGGQKQRIVIAMAISCKPKLLIADEPTTALDVTVQAEILELLKSLQKLHGMSMIFITHDLGVVQDIADHIAVMYRGEIVEAGPAKQILDKPSHPYTQGLMACRPPLQSRPRRLPTLADWMAGDTDLAQTTLISDEQRQERLAKLYSREALLSVSHVGKSYVSGGGFFNPKRVITKAVDDVSFDVYPGETLGLVGESGCGKTTLSRIILGLIPKDAGELRWRGETLDWEKQSKTFRKEIQIIFQDPYSSLNPALTVGQAIAEPMKVHGLERSKSERQRKTLALLDKVGLPAGAAEKYPHEFSGGQRQRIVIARTLAVEPKFIICDESVSALDVSVQAQILNLLNDLKDELGLTYIFISHDLAVVRYMSDRIMVMNKGVIEELGDADSVFLSPQSNYTRQLLEAIPGIK